MMNKTRSKKEKLLSEKFHGAQVSDFRDEREYRLVRKKIKRQMSKTNRRENKIDIKDY